MDLSRYARYVNDVRMDIGSDATVVDTALAVRLMNLCGILENMAVDIAHEIEAARTEPGCRCPSCIEKRRS